MMAEPMRAQPAPLDFELRRAARTGPVVTELGPPAPGASGVPVVVCPSCHAPLDLDSLVDRLVALRTRVTHDVRDPVVTNRERAVLDALLQGYRTHQIALLLGISSHTVRKHLRSLYVKTDCASQAELVAWARANLDRV
jgi:DNA-binding CsgD family transcriptional regulator